MTEGQPTAPLPYPYHLGMEFPVMPAPLIAEHCVNVPAGAITLVVEARDLIADRAQTHPGLEARSGDPQFDDFGASLHVMSAYDGAEYLRFDCFDKEPHYHYIRPAKQVNVICRLDDVAEGDPIEWTISRLRQRLPEMLVHAGAGDLADAVRVGQAAVTTALAETEGLLREAQRRTIARRAAAADSAPLS